LIARVLLLATLVNAGCGQRIVDGEFLGDATIRLNGLMQTYVGQPSHAVVGALWLGYGALLDRARGLEPAVLPISSYRFPPAFTCDVLDAPPSVGQYVTADDRVVPATMRLGRLLVLDDVDGDGRFALDDSGQLLPPDRLLAVAAHHALLFVDQVPDDRNALDGQILLNWEAVDHGYYVVELAATVAAPDLSARVVDAHAEVLFTTPTSPSSW
jgi:hypothetical protein